MKLRQTSSKNLTRRETQQVLARLGQTIPAHTPIGAGTIATITPNRRDDGENDMLKLSVCLATLILILATAPLEAQRATNGLADVPTTLALMHGKSWTERDAGFKAATNRLQSRNETPQDTDRLRSGLIQLLVTESHRQDPVAESDLDEYSNYFGDLIGAVSDLKDPRAIPALLGVANSGGMATRGLAYFGKAALDAVLEQVKGPNVALASGALFVIRDMLEYRTAIDPDSSTKIANALRASLSSPEWRIRLSSIDVIEYFDNRTEFVPILADMAANDPFEFQGQGSAGYPVRSAAQSLLAKIGKHEPPAIDRGVHP